MADRAGERDVSVGRVFARTFGVVGRHPLVVLGTALILGALPRMGIGWLQLRFAAAADAAGFWSEAGFFVLSSVAGLVFSMLVQGAVTGAALAHAAGERLDWWRGVRTGLRAAVPLAALAIVSSVAIGAGLVLLIVPGLLLFVMWAVAAPALVAERTGVAAALTRSARLTAGARPLVLGIELLAAVLYWVVSVMLFLAGVALGAGPGWLLLGVGGGWAASLLTAVAGTIRSALWAALQTSLYVELRDWKDGPEARALASIFG